MLNLFVFIVRVDNFMCAENDQQLNDLTKVVWND